MRQFDVFDNPVARARRAYPYVVVLQADLADTGRERIVAPLAPLRGLRGSAGRLTPHVQVDGVDHAVLVPSLTAIPTSDLRDARAHLAQHREAFSAALDYLFFGV